MTTFEDRTNTFKNSMERANNREINRLGNDNENRALSIEEMMKQRDAELFNVDYIANNVNPIIRNEMENDVDKTMEERIAELTTMDFDQSTIKKKTYTCTMFNQSIDIKLLRVYECYPPIYEFGPGFCLPNLPNEISLPSDFVFKRSHTTQFNTNLSFIMKYGDDEFVNDYGNTGYMYVGSTQESRDIEGIRCIKFNEASTNGNSFVFEYNEHKNTLSFVHGNYHLNGDQCEVFDGISKSKMCTKMD